MKAPRSRLSKGRFRYRDDNVRAVHTVPVAVTFRLYDRLGHASDVGSFKPRPPGQAQSEPYWVYIFQHGWDGSIQLTHEVFVDAHGAYNHVDCHAERQVAERPPGVDPYRSVVLSSAHYQNGVRRAFRHYVLFSPFQIPTSRVDYILPGGRIDSADKRGQKQFVDWAKARELNLLVFTPAEERTGAVRSLWAPWLKAQAMVDQYDAAVYQYAKRCLDQEDRFKVAEIVQSLSSVCDVSKYVSMDNIKALYADLPRVLEPCKQTSDALTEYVGTPAIQELILDMWADDTEDACHALFPYLSSFYHAVRTEKLLEWADSRFFDFKLKTEMLSTSKVVRRTAKAIWEINSMFAAALIRHNYPAQRLNVYVRGAQWYMKKLFGMELKWTDVGWDRSQISRVRSMAGRAHLFLTLIHCLDTINVLKARAALAKEPESVRAQVALVGACASEVSTVLKTIAALTKPSEVDAAQLVASAEQFLGASRSQINRFGGLHPEELQVLRKLTAKQEVMNVLKRIPHDQLGAGLGFVTGVSDFVTGGSDAYDAWVTGNLKAAAFLGLIAVGGLILAGSAVTFPFWAAALGQGLQLVGLIGAGVFQSSEFELWLRFCCFGSLAASTIAHVKRPWTGNLTLTQLATSPPRVQVRAFYELVFGVSIAAQRVRFERIADQLDLSVSFAYACPNDGLVYLRIVLLKTDGTSLLFRPLSPWTNAVRKFASDKKTVVELSQMLDGGDVLLGVRTVAVEVWLDVNGGMEFYPEKPVLKHFDVGELPWAN